LKFVKYGGKANGYLLILTNKKRLAGSIPQADEVPVAVLYAPKGQVIAVSELDFEILKEQGHIAKGQLMEVPEKTVDETKPILSKREIEQAAKSWVVQGKQGIELRWKNLTVDEVNDEFEVKGEARDENDVLYDFTVRVTKTGEIRKEKSQAAVPSKKRLF